VLYLDDHRGFSQYWPTDREMRKLVTAILASMVLVLGIAPAAEGRTRSQRAESLICLPSSTIKLPGAIRCAHHARASVRQRAYRPRSTLIAASMREFAGRYPSPR
jgi:hypothetical protein